MKFSAAALFLLSSCSTLPLEAEGCLNKCIEKCEIRKKCASKKSVKKQQRCTKKCTMICTERCVPKTTSPTATPTASTPVGGGGPAVAIGTGHEFSCAIVPSGHVKCWGSNGWGQLGGNLPASYVTVPGTSVTVLLTPLTKAVALHVGVRTACAILNSGVMQCWGYGYGSTPVDVQGLGGKPVKVSIADWFSCVILDSGAVRCISWVGGVPFAGLHVLSGTAIAIDAARGNEHVCAVISGGGLDCWGYNFFGQLGDGTKISKNTAISVQGLGGKAVGVGCGNVHTCVVLDSGDVKCMGQNSFGQLGNGDRSHRYTPTPVVNLGGKAVAVACGFYHTCVVLIDGNMKCWGQAEFGKLGDGSPGRNIKLTPVSVVGLGGKAVALHLGWDTTCALLDDNTMKCWGRNGDGQLGDGTTNKQKFPVSVTAI